MIRWEWVSHFLGLTLNSRSSSQLNGRLSQILHGVLGVELKLSLTVTGTNLNSLATVCGVSETRRIMVAVGAAWMAAWSGLVVCQEAIERGGGGEDERRTGRHIRITIHLVHQSVTIPPLCSSRSFFLDSCACYLFNPVLICWTVVVGEDRGEM